jgi:hypothetical protein
MILDKLINIGVMPVYFVDNNPTIDFIRSVEKCEGKLFEVNSLNIAFFGY